MPDLSPTGRGRVVALTTFGTIFCVAVALFVDSFNFPSYDDAARLRAILTDIGLPVILAVPLIGYFTSKLRELAIAHQKLTVYASTDSLTGILNRGAFSTLVDAYLKEVRAEPSRGALLVIDADNFKSINDTYGHDRGDEALKSIASSIKSMVRSPDLVGRIGGEEFGVFLPGAGHDQAAKVAERICASVHDASFAPDGTRRELTVSVGGASFDRRIGFDDLFRVADQQLYAAKQAGRNRVMVSPIVRYEPIPLAANAA
jgi:diguanylate cyclase (GGDEF)-like protein